MSGTAERIITSYKGPQRRVLVVDDIPSNRAVLVAMLRPVGFEVIEAADGQEAVTLAEATRPDLILMDQHMPIQNGLEAARQIRQNPALREVPLISVSASVSESDQSLSREAGYDAFLPKPVGWPRLTALLAEYLHLEWEYGTQKREEKVFDESSSAGVMIPPPEVLAELHEFAKMGDIRRIREEAVQWERQGGQYQPFARQLRGLAEGYQAKAILALLEQYLKKGE